MSETKVCIDCDSEFDVVYKAGGKKKRCDDCTLVLQRERCRQYKQRNKEKISSYNAIYKAENKKSVSEYNKKYNVENREAIQNRQRVQHNQRRKNDPGYKFAVIMRTRMGKFMKGTKSQNSMDLLGCTLGDFRMWFEYRFTPEMTWENHGTVWHYDHVIPCAIFDQSDPNEQEKCWHWSNYQPLLGPDNLAKNNKISVNEIKSHMIKVNSFVEEYNDEISEKLTLLEYDREEYANC